MRWSHYTLKNGTGFGIIDHALTGREITGNTPIVYLMAATDDYNGHPNPWLSGKGKHHFRYLIIAHEKPWEEVNIPRMAWEFNSTPFMIPNTKKCRAESFVST